ncbi:exosome complex exonuclease RRP43 [Xylariaceae sp. FL1651]|nr:exosome complex exonuclease RRP43 [Xylariaceae sp. FL1651]
MTTQSSLTLSSATFAKLSPHPYLLANLQPPDASTPSSRTNGRQPTQARPPAINTSSLTHAHGSAVVRTGDTTVICGVRGETLATSQIPNYRASVSTSSGRDSESNDATNTNELRDYDLLVPNIELATGCAPNFLPGVPPTTLAQTLGTRVYSLLHSSRILDVADLRIYQDTPPAGAHNNSNNKGDGGDWNKDDDEDEDMRDTEVEDTDVPPRREVKAYWVLYIDLLFISFDGNPFDAAWAAVLAALRDTRLPHAYWDADREMVLCSRREQPVRLSVLGLPVACTAAVFTAKERLKQNQSKKASGNTGPFWILVDPDRFEEGLCDETVTVVVDRSGEDGETKILGISKSGGTVVGPDVMRRFVKVAEGRWQEFQDALFMIPYG